MKTNNGMKSSFALLHFGKLGWDCICTKKNLDCVLVIQFCQIKKKLNLTKTKKKKCGSISKHDLKSN